MNHLVEFGNFENEEDLFLNDSLLSNYQVTADEYAATIGTVQTFLDRLKYEQSSTNEAKYNLAAAMFTLTALAGSYGFTMAELMDDTLDRASFGVWVRNENYHYV
jgi:hypothetical protein